jgi:undecaprenyl-diphosphatase
MRRLAVALLTVCIAITVLLGVLFAHHTRPGTLDAAVDARVQADLGGHPALLSQLAGLGDRFPVAVMATVLFLGCLVMRRWRGAVLVAVAVPVANVLAEHILKPLVGRTLTSGALSFPSGHETRVFAVAAALAVLFAEPLRAYVPAVLRLLLASAVLVAVAAVAVALVGEGAHYFTDTVGGAAVGTAVVLVTALALDWLIALSRPAGSDYEGARSGPMADTDPATPAEARASGAHRRRAGLPRLSPEVAAPRAGGNAAALCVY